jgi:putative ABC transport system permease protein
MEKSMTNEVLEAAWRDIRMAIRTLYRNRGMSIVAVLILALGIGANTAAFSVIKTVILHPVPFTEPDRLVLVWETRLHMHKQELVLPQNFAAWKETATSTFDQLSAIQQQTLVLTGSGEPEELVAEAVSANYFGMLGVRPIQGRGFAEGEDRTGQERVVVISKKLWQEHFASDPRIVGTFITLNGAPSKVIGIVPDFYSWKGRQTEAWSPLVLNVPLPARYLSIVGRLKSGIALGAAQLRMESIAQRLELAYPDVDKGWTVSLVPFKDQLVGDIRPTIFALLAAVILVLLIACANIANMLLAQLIARQRQLGIQKALGATKWMIIRELLAESIILAIVGGVLGLCVAYGAIGIIAKFGPHNIPRLGEAAIDKTILGLTALMSILTGFVFGIVPAVRGSRVDLVTCLKNGSSTVAGSHKSRVRDFLVVGQIALAMVILAGAGLMLNSFRRLESRDLGFNPEHLLSAKIRLPGLQYRETTRKLGFFNELLQRVNATPSVSSSALVSSLPADRLVVNMPIRVVGESVSPVNQPLSALQIIGGKYFETMGIPMKRGRTFTESEMQRPGPQIIINEKLAGKMFPGQDPIGKQLILGDEGSPPQEIVGVAGDVTQAAIDTAPEPIVYWPYVRLPFGSMAVIVKTSSSTSANIARDIIEQVHALDHNQPVSDVMSMDDAIAGAVSRSRFDTQVFGLFAFVALILAAMGIYSLISYNVDQGKREVGIRMALGASRGAVLRNILKRTAKIVGWGLVGGGVLSFCLSRFLSSLLFGVRPDDPVTMGVVVLLLVLVAFLASYVPARRGSDVNPVVALRYE